MSKGTVLMGGLVLALALVMACGGGDGGSEGEVVATPTNTPAPTSALAAHGSVAGTSAQTVTVEITDFAHRLGELSLEPGQMVEFRVTNASQSLPHTFTIRDWDIDLVLTQGEAKTVQVPDDASSTTQYVCRFHEGRGMKGSISVTGGVPPAPETPGTGGGATEEPALDGDDLYN